MSAADRIRAAWRGASKRARVHAVLLLLVTAGAVGHQASLWLWFIEDAAISFAYAKHWVEGHGLVAFPGAERVEGFSNPLWVAVLALMHAVGLELFTAVKWLQVALTATTVPVVYLAAREATGHDDDSDVPIIAAALLAAHSQFAIWGSSGLENGLLNLLFALGLWRMWVEVRTGARPLSALLWLGVALCRPETILYAAIAGFLTMVFHLQARRAVAPTVWWLLLFFVPFLSFQAARYQYFAWPFPNTYYAKEKSTELIRWTTRAWMWSRRYAEELGHGFFLPAYLLGILGHRGWRLAAAVVAFAVITTSVEWSHDQRWLVPAWIGVLWAGWWLGVRSSHPSRRVVVGGLVVALLLLATTEALRAWGIEPTQLRAGHSVRTGPPWVLGAAALLLPLLGIGTRGWRARVTCWWMFVGAIFFAVWSQGDWMKGFRWYAISAVPGSILLAFGVQAVGQWLQEMLTDRPEWGRPGQVVAVLLVAAFIPFQVNETWTVGDKPDARPEGVRKRVRYITSVRERLHHDGPWVAMDVDMGGHLYWSDFVMVDMAGLVDVPFGHHRYQREFVSEYVFQERQPHSAHVHLFWSNKSGVPSHPEWKRDYIEIPGYGGKALHGGNHIRRELLFPKQWPHGPGRRVSLGEDWVLEGLVVPSEPAPGRRMYVELGVRTSRPPKPGTDGVRLWLALSTADGQVATWDLPLAYDWIPLDEWRPDEVFVGRYTPRLPRDLPPGPATLAVALVGPDGEVIAATGEELSDGVVVPDGEEVQALLAVGEVQLPGAVRVWSVEETGKGAIADREAAIEAAHADRCKKAERGWWLARAHRAGDREWEQMHTPRVSRALADCWARRADGDPDPSAQVAALTRARDWDRDSPAVTSRGRTLGEQLHSEGLVARESEDWEAAFRLFSDAVTVDPTRAWSRRYAEEARSHRLGIDPP